MTQDKQSSEEEQKSMAEYGITHEKKSVYLLGPYADHSIYFL
jgi:hypothetical protein